MKAPPTTLPELLTACVAGLQLLALKQAHRETHSLHIEPRHAPLLRTAATQAATFTVRPAPAPALSLKTRPQVTPAAVPPLTLKQKPSTQEAA